VKGERRERGGDDRLAGPLCQQVVLAQPGVGVLHLRFPLMFLVIFTSLLGHGTVQIGVRSVNTATYYVASMASFAVITTVPGFAFSIIWQANVFIS
jgi:hypothetical protein